MADLATDEAAAARVAAAKLRLMRLAQDAGRVPPLLSASAELVRAHPWRAIALGFVAGVGLGLAPRRTLARIAPMLAPLLSMVASSATPDSPLAGAGDGRHARRRRP